MHQATAFAQCKVIVKGSNEGCAPYSVGFAVDAGSKQKDIKSWNWSFGDASTSTDSLPQKIYINRGTYKPCVTITYKDNTTSTCCADKDILIFASPKSVINPPKFGTTCATKYNYYFTHSSIAGADSFPIVKYQWTFGDGDISSLPNPSHKYSTNGSYTVSLTVTDSKGCKNISQYTFISKNPPQLNPSLTTNLTGTCTYIDAHLHLTCDTSALGIKSFYWEFGDGTFDSSGKNWDSVVHRYSKSGTNYARIFITDKFGCSYSVYSPVAVQVSILKPYIHTKYEECFSTEKNQGVTFYADSLNGVTGSWTIDYDPPAIGNSYTKVLEPGVHWGKFECSPNNKFCKKIDTCVVVVIKGPKASIEGKGRNDAYIPEKIPNSYYNAFNKNLKCDTIPKFDYAIYVQRNPVTYTIPRYCKSDTISIKTDTFNPCNSKRKFPYVRSLQLKPVSSYQRTLNDSVQIIKSYTRGDPIPKNTYFPDYGYNTVYLKGADLFPDNSKPHFMHDSDRYSCSPNNYVLFTNNSVKFRGYYATDDTAFGINEDTCLNKNYPYPSDSMKYLWKFYDPTGKPCTSSVAKRDIACNTSTEVVPYHFYNNQKPPDDRCYRATLVVTDTWKDINGKTVICLDSATTTIQAGGPDAGWDKTNFCHMNWDIQQQLGGQGRKGFKLKGINCTNSKLSLDGSELLPQCAKGLVWLEPDSAKDRYAKCVGASNDTVYDFKWLPQFLYPSITYPSGDTGCKTIGVVFKTGECTDTVWYHDYICLKQINAGFCTGTPDKKTWNCEVYGSIHTCPDSLGRATFFITPEARNQERITAFNFIIQRIANDISQPYYSFPFWPEIPSLFYQEVFYNKSLTTNQDTLYLPAANTITFNSYNDKGILTGSHPTVGVYFNKKEINSFNKNGFINLNSTDYRFRKFNTGCKDLSVKLSALPSVLPLKITDTVYIKDLSKNTDTIPVKVDLPGVYEIRSYAKTLDGCDANEQRWVINGHSAVFFANDSIVCLNEPVTFKSKIRYWDSGNFPELNEDLIAWDVYGGDTLRKTLNPGWSQDSLYFDEPLPEWDFGDGSPHEFSLKPAHTYKKAGVYTVTLTTIDSNHCRIVTSRKNYMKVIDINADFTVKPLRDTDVFCAPRLITYKDKTLLQLTPYSKGKYARSVERVIHTFPPDKTHNNYYDSITLDTVIIDSIVNWQWTIGDGRPPINVSKKDSLIFEYISNGKYTVKLRVTTIQCEDTAIKPQYINIHGPIAEFKPLDSVGCVPFTFRVKLKYIRGKLYNWNKGDSTVEIDNRDSAKDSIIYLTYTKPGRYSLTLTEEDSVHDFYNDTTINCIATWPDTINNPYLPRFHINVYPHPPVSIKSIDTVCVGDVLLLNAVADSIYTKFSWDFGNGKTIKDTTGRTAYTVYDKEGDYTVTLVAKTPYCSENAVKKIFVRDVIADFDTLRSDLTTFTFDNNSKFASRYEWYFGDVSKLLQTSDTGLIKHDYNKYFIDDGDQSRQNEDSFVFKVCLKAFNQVGCMDDTCKEIKFLRVWQTYNVFTPNNDGINDEFVLTTKGEVNYHLMIFNRWGEKVYESNKGSENWNGKVFNTGFDCPPGTYFWLWDFQLIGLPSIRKAGTVTLIR